MADQAPFKSVAERIEDAMREIGTLLLALAPLDAVLSGSAAWFLLFFLSLGASLFLIALLLERRRRGVAL